MTRAWATLFLLLIGTLSAPASADAQLDVEVGWGGSYRHLRWSPIFITAADAKARPVVIELKVPHDTVHSMTIRQLVTIGPAPTTFVLYAPLPANISEASVTLLDPRSGRRLANWVNDPTYGLGSVIVPETVNQLIGISGRNTSNRLIEGQFDRQVVAVKSIDLNRLPTVARGYESFNTLMLDQPDLARLTSEQQHAIVDWVRMGGHLVCWLGEDQLPPMSPILQQLPAVVGENTTIQVSRGALESAGLSPRFGNMKGRSLTRTPDAIEIPLLGGEVQAYRRQLQLGTIVLIPFDCSTLLINGEDRPAAFWKPLLDGAVDLTKRSDESQNNYYYYGYNDPGQMRRSNAASNIMNQLGDVPGAGSFGFSWVTLVMVGLMLVVGPVDWIVLKRLGRQPWTWITTSGWIALVTLGALFMGHTLKSGDLHYRTLRMIDQSGDSVVAVCDAVGIYSPRTADYELKTQPDGWWEPLSADQYYYRSGMKTEVNFHQDYQGNTPQRLRINVWNLRFLSSDVPASGPPLVSADLRVETRADGRHVVGTLKNTGTMALKQLCLRTRTGYCHLDRVEIAPGATTNVDQRLVSNPPPTTRHGNFGPYQETDPPGGEHFFRLAVERSSRIDRLLQTRDDLVVVYADCIGAQAVAPLDPAPTEQSHWQMLRAVLPLTGSNR